MTMFENADLEIIRFRAEDIIATSTDEDDTDREGDTGSEGGTGDRQPEPDLEPR